MFIFTVSVFCFLFLAATILGADEGATDPVVFAGNITDFEYKGSRSLNYASCSLTDNIKAPDGEQNTMLDFAFMSTIAYLEDSAASSAARTWFDTTVNVLDPIVHEFKSAYQAEHGVSSVSYKLFEFPDQNLKVVAVRGTANAWDALTDAQIWDGAMFSQYVRAALPFGSIWNELLPYLVLAISFVEDSTLKDIAYYRETTAFVNHLKNDLGFNVEIVGHCKFGRYTCRFVC